MTRSWLEALREADVVRAIVGSPDVLTSVLLRALVLWGLLRTALWLVALPLEIELHGLLLSVGVCLAGTVLAVIDSRVTREAILLRNLGMPTLWLATATAVPILALEVLFVLSAA